MYHCSSPKCSQHNADVERPIIDEHGQWCPVCGSGVCSYNREACVYCNDAEDERRRSEFRDVLQQNAAALFDAVRKSGGSNPSVRALTYNRTRDTAVVALEWTGAECVTHVLRHTACAVSRNHLTSAEEVLFTFWQQVTA
jgi:hypothetical protein